MINRRRSKNGSTRARHPQRAERCCKTRARRSPKANSREGWTETTPLASADWIHPRLEKMVSPFFFWSLESPSLTFDNAIQQGDNNVGHMQNLLAICKAYPLSSEERQSWQDGSDEAMFRGWCWGFKFYRLSSSINHVWKCFCACLKHQTLSLSVFSVRWRTRTCYSLFTLRWFFCTPLLFLSIFQSL